jgi:hypothetical protein
VKGSLTGRVKATNIASSAATSTCKAALKDQTSQPYDSAPAEEHGSESVSTLLEESLEVTRLEMHDTGKLTFKAFLSHHRWERYWQNGGTDGLLRSLCLFTWFLSLSFDEDDTVVVSRGLLNSEVLLSFTIVLLWLRCLQILEVFQTTGPLVVMLSQIWKDVVRHGSRGEHMGHSPDGWS